MVTQINNCKGNMNVKTTCSQSSYSHDRIKHLDSCSCINVTKQRRLRYPVLLSLQLAVVFPIIALLLPATTVPTVITMIHAASYSVTLKAKDTDCYVFRVPKTPVTISGNFDCYEQGNSFLRSCRKVEVWIESIPFHTGHHFHRDKDHQSSPYIWESDEDSAKSVFHIPVNQDPKSELKTKYQLCFETSSKDDDEAEESEEDDNIPNSIQIGFHLYVQNIAQRTLPDNESGPDEKRALSVINTASLTEQHWHSLLDHFDYMRNREAIQIQLMGQTSKRVIGWSIIETFLVISMAIAQVCYWKSFFEQRRYL